MQEHALYPHPSSSLAAKALPSHQSCSANTFGQVCLLFRFPEEFPTGDGRRGCISPRGLIQILGMGKALPERKHCQEQSLSKDCTAGNEMWVGPRGLYWFEEELRVWQSNGTVCPGRMWSLPPMILDSKLWIQNPTWLHSCVTCSR